MEKTITNSAGYTFTTYHFKAKGNLWRVAFIKGPKSDCVEVCKLTNNPYGGRMGRTFANIDEAQAAYKCADLKVQLLLIQSEIF